ncbi:BON domain-containing protein [Allopusillimonas soli]|nr:BON domain-containing protein [Allopusillimonas soli]
MVMWANEETGNQMNERKQQGNNREADGGPRDHDGQPAGNTEDGRIPSSPRMPQGEKAEVDYRSYAEGRQFGKAGDYGRAHQKLGERPPDPESPTHIYPPPDYSQDDERIRESIHASLAESGLADEAVSIDVNRGCVRLTGFLPDREAWRHAELMAKNCPGVKEVRNEIEVSRR